MGRIAAHTQEQVFEAADKLAVEGEEVTPTALREVLGRGSFSTLGKHIEAWLRMRQAAPTPVILEMPEIVKVAFAQCWQAAAAEAGKEIAAVREKADAEIKGTKRRLDEALSEVERLEEEANADAARMETINGELAVAQAVATDATAREAVLSATVEQMRQQIEAQQVELARVHTEAEAVRNQHTAEAARLADQLKDQKTRCVDLEAGLTATRKGEREAAAQLGRAQGELDALRAQVASLNDIVRSLAAQDDKKGKKVQL
ncbi:DNA-binding protein [Verminephrobacter aporrectodeae subsp. tuberculatae]|uniref:DNA-binding protein n=1 Tax=Verminephrobacter aporrectodeae TaxID=1110389 RepID=UPI0022436A94|nr:DNA-binding protein [Verminephrobacter aporrectodeae]MCW8208080.1 DNA-binding protein [Verminephrobacter aporrectodeae subsp. tuberculatae]